MIYLSKILPVFFLPIGVTLILILIGLILRRRSLIVLACVLLYLCGTPLVGRMALRKIQGDGERGLAQDAVSADAIVVLSGGRIVAPGNARVSEWTDADRFFGGIELFLAGKAPLLIFTGGWLPWEPGARAEGEILVEYARMFGLPEEAVVTTGKVVNTAGEAGAVAKLVEEHGGALLQEKRDPMHILLVTSAFHMPRAQVQFEREGFHVTPFPVDFFVSVENRASVLDFFPSAGALGQTELALREFYGRIFHRVF